MAAVMKLPKELALGKVVEEDDEDEATAEDETDAERLDAAEDLLKAVKAGDAQGVVDALDYLLSVSE